MRPLRESKSESKSRQWLLYTTTALCTLPLSLAGAAYGILLSGVLLADVLVRHDGDYAGFFMTLGIGFGVGTLVGVLAGLWGVPELYRRLDRIPDVLRAVLLVVLSACTLLSVLLILSLVLGG